ncbi:hypothetical protein K458DRAFT_72830 [Lentithecium fluviatile CBS 122367]|uniref:Uncharacterized protein n=1 Tax=Lentithecium fluviatile CBS 122367 TaxID=1168545 RepID=A0A6G1IW41_9PLEO|nr:hypothetical protein K458DRAFT_72830 [Lentithecium fluviatile CBS 122367]
MIKRPRTLQKHHLINLKLKHCAISVPTLGTIELSHRFRQAPQELHIQPATAAIVHIYAGRLFEPPQSPSRGVALSSTRPTDRPSTEVHLPSPIRFCQSSAATRSIAQKANPHCVKTPIRFHLLSRGWRFRAPTKGRVKTPQPCASKRCSLFEKTTAAPEEWRSSRENVTSNVPSTDHNRRVNPFDETLIRASRNPRFAA